MIDTDARLRAIQLLINAMQRYKDRIYEKCKDFQSEDEHINAIQNGEFDALIDVDRIRQLATTCRTLEEFAEAIENEQLALDSFDELIASDSSDEHELEDAIMKLFGSNECEYLRKRYLNDMSCIMAGEEIGVELFVVRIRKAQSFLDEYVEMGMEDLIKERLNSDRFEYKYLRRYYPGYVGKEIGVEPFVVTIGDGFEESEKSGLYMALQDSKFAYGYINGHSHTSAIKYSFPEWHNDCYSSIEYCAELGRKVLEGLPIQYEQNNRRMHMRGEPVNASERGE